MLYDPKWEEKIEVKLEPWQEVLLKAADLIRENGLAKHIRKDEAGGYCIHGAVSMAMYNDETVDHYDGDHNTQTVMRRVVSYLHSQKIDTHCTSSNWIAAQWNNRPERTKKEVIAVLEGAAHAV